MKIATLCYIQDNDKVLMIHRNKRPEDKFYGFWNGVGGKVAEGESPEECIIREVREETGLTISDPQLKGILTFPNNHQSGESWYVFVFVAREFSGKLAENYEGTLHWVPFDDIADLHIQDADKHFLPWLNKSGVFSAKFNYEGDKMKDQSVAFYV